ncbi:MAG: xanthine dehydrogenase family protein subunit M [Alphaproteobacteria bacterium]|nr:xanthine dehydrogenase family protein subunit M [Alphaproteobacteria bacterium]
MKAAPFDYVRVTTVAEVCRALDGAGGEGKIIAGGQTLVPMMAMRLARPTLLVDINDVSELQGIAATGGALKVKACTRQAAALASPLVAATLPLLARAMRWVGHGQTRNRGTVGGSIAHADPSAEIPLVAVTLGATIEARRSASARLIEADAFFEGPMMTALAADECLTEVRFPVWPEAHVGSGFEEVSARRGDFAIVAAAAQVALAPDGRCTRVAVGIGGAGGRAVNCAPAAGSLFGTRLDDATIDAAAGRIAALIEPQDDIHATADYRRRAAAALAARALRSARADAATKAAA